MDDVNSCFLCKSLNLEANSVDVDGALLENIVRLKVLGELPVDFPQTVAKLRMCHDCLSVVVDIQSSVSKLKDRIVNRKFRVRYANVHFNKKEIRKASVPGSLQTKFESPTSHLDADEADESESEEGSRKDHPTQGDDRRDSLNSVLSSVSGSNVGLSNEVTVNNVNSDNYMREVHIKVPASVNATFIVVQSPDDITDYGSITNSQTVHTLLQRKQVSDVITAPAFANARYMDLKKRIDSPSVSTTRLSDESPVENGTNDLDSMMKEPVKEPFKKRRQSFHSSNNLPKFHALRQPLKTDPSLRCRSLTTSPVCQITDAVGEQNTYVPSIRPNINPSDHVLDLSSSSMTPPHKYSPQLVPDENYQDYLNHRRRSYDVHYPAVTFDRLVELQQLAMMREQESPNISYAAGNVSYESGDIRYSASNLPIIEEPQRVIHCDLCTKVFERKGLWKRHMLSAHQDQAFTCSQCGMKFVDRMSLHVHESREHGHIAGSLQLAIPTLQHHHAPAQLAKHAPSVVVTESGSAADSACKDQKVRKKMQYCEDCREHFTSKYDLLRHRVTTGHMGGAGGVCSDRGDADSRMLRAGIHSRMNPYQALQRENMFIKNEGSGMRRMESLDDTAVPCVKSENLEKYYVDRRHSEGALLLNQSVRQSATNRHQLAEQNLRQVSEPRRHVDRGGAQQVAAQKSADNDGDCVVYSADGQQYPMKVSSSSDGHGADGDSP